MFKYRSSKPVTDPGYLVTQPNQAFTVRQILDQFARGEVIPTQFQSTDTLGDDIPDDEVDNVVEFEDSLDAQSHLITNQYKLIENEIVSSEKQESSSEAGTSSDSSSNETAN